MNAEPSRFDPVRPRAEEFGIIASKNNAARNHLHCRDMWTGAL